MRSLILVVAFLALGGCATAAEREVARMRDTAERAGGASDGCWARAQAQPSYVSLSGKLTLKIDMSPTLMQRTDTTKPTAEDRQALGDLHRDWLAPCRKVQIDGAAAILPALRRVMVQYAEREDAVYAALLQGRMSWGEANTELAAIRIETTQAVDEIASRAAQELHREHAAEIERRRIAIGKLADAFGKAAEQMRDRANRYPQPRQTICQNVGGYLTCTTY
jgi:hypothetical protein